MNSVKEIIKDPKTSLIKTSTSLSTSINPLEEVLQGILNHGTEILKNCVIDKEIADQYLSTLEFERLDYARPSSSIDISKWNITKKYILMDVEQELYSRCSSDVEVERVKLELELYKKNGLFSALKTMFYIVDTLRENNIIWGVGRGSSVASYVLFLIGIHKVDSIKYNLPIQEFFKET